MNIELKQEHRDGLNGRFPLWVLYRDGAFIIGGQSRQETERRLETLKGNGWRYLDCYDRGHPEPLGWIEHVRKQGWTFGGHSQLEIGADGRAFFGGIVEYSAAFRYLMLDPDLVAKVQQAAPEVRVLLPS